MYIIQDIFNTKIVSYGTSAIILIAYHTFSHSLEKWAKDWLQILRQSPQKT